MADIFSQADLIAGAEFGDSPESVKANVADMSAIIAQRRAGNVAVAAKNDTERYLVVVYKDRAAREAALAELGLPGDERYVMGGAVQLCLRPGNTLDEARINAARSAKAAPVEHSGAAG